MLYSGTDPESYITEYNLIYEENICDPHGPSGGVGQCQDHSIYRGTSLIRNTPLLGPYSRTIPRVIRRS